MFNFLTNRRMFYIAVIITGGILGSLAGYFVNNNALAGAVLGIILGAIPGFLTVMPGARHHKAILHLKEEKLDVSKKRVRTGMVTVHKELVKEQKNVVVPTTREELVIERQFIDPQKADSTGEHRETIRIPLSEERIEIIKQPVALNDVSVYNHQYQETVTIEEPCKKEELVIETTGEPEIITKQAAEKSDFKDGKIKI